jgi:tRNA A58 N-methylase Trm61
VTTLLRALALLLLAALPQSTPPLLDAAGAAMLHPARAQALQPAALIARLALPPAAVIADVGAGPGWLTLPLARAVPRGHVIATDVRADYLAVAQARAAEAGVRNLETRVVAPEEPGLAPASIDLALLCQVDAYLPDRARYLSRLAEALAPEGRIAVVTAVRHRAVVLDAARAAGLATRDEWSPSPLYVLLTFARGA